MTYGPFLLGYRTLRVGVMSPAHFSSVVPECDLSKASLRGTFGTRLRLAGLRKARPVRETRLLLHDSKDLCLNAADVLEYYSDPHHSTTNTVCNRLF